MPVSKCVVCLNPALEHVEPQPFRPQLLNALMSATAELAVGAINWETRPTAAPPNDVNVSPATMPTTTTAPSKTRLRISQSSYLASSLGPLERLGKEGDVVTGSAGGVVGDDLVPARWAIGSRPVPSQGAGDDVAVLLVGRQLQHA